MKRSNSKRRLALMLEIPYGEYRWLQRTAAKRGCTLDDVVNSLIEKQRMVQTILKAPHRPPDTSHIVIGERIPPS